MSLPNLSNALKNWKQDIVLIEVSKTQNENLTNTITTKETPFKAVVQPLSAFDINFQPAEMRGLEWIMVHIEANSPVILKLNDRIRWGFKEFSVKKVKNYTNSFLQTNKSVYRSQQTYGYIEYHACEMNVKNNINYTIND